MTYLWRDIDDKLWKKAKAKAAENGVSIRELLVNLLTQWVDNKMSN